MKNEDSKNLKRPPVVVVVGHVDHGKTSLLDYIRKTNVVAKEAGAITQSIGAYEITHNEQRITFIDTPGHEAFSKMRIRGTRVADVAILVVAADESIKPQAKEAIQVLYDSKTPFVVAITKIDKPNADLERVKNGLTTNNVLLEGYGGSISYQGVSSKTGEGINELLDLILLTAEVENLTYNPDNLASGMVLETERDNRRGNTVTVILKDGTLKRGDLILTPTAKGKVKILEDFLGKPVTELLPSSPAVILGFEELPETGDEFKSGKLSLKELEAVKAVSRKSLATVTADEQTVKVILKADVAGSLEALSDLIKKTPLKEGQRLEIISQSIGVISDGDVKDAVATKSIILGFMVYPNKAAENLARGQDITIITNEVIYKLVEEVEKILLQIFKKDTSAELEILAVFSGQGRKQTIGGKVNKGMIKTKARLEIHRGEETLGQGRILNLQQKKQDVNVINSGNECGLVFESDVKIEIGDKLLS